MPIVLKSAAIVARMRAAGRPGGGERGGRDGGGGARGRDHGGAGRAIARAIGLTIARLLLTS